MLKNAFLKNNFDKYRHCDFSIIWGGQNEVMNIYNHVEYC